MMKMNKKIWACLWTCLFFVQNSTAKLVKDEHYVIKENLYTWKQVCLDLTKRPSPLIEYKTVSKLDCMGEVLDVIAFCDKKEAANPYFTRAVVDKEKEAVKCQSAKRVIIKWQCEGKQDRYCKDVEIGCFLFKEKLARRLKIVHQSLTDEKVLNCYFGIPNNSID